MNSPGPVISVEQLAIWLGFITTTEMKPRSVVVVDCRFSLAEPMLGRSQYEAGHIPGAFYLDLNQDLSIAAPPNTLGGRHPLPDLALFIAKLRAIGVGPRTWVVAYDDARFAFASRLWWLLRYLGHEQVAVLDGGWQGWLNGKNPVSEGRPPEIEVSEFAPRGPFQPRINPQMLVDRAAVEDYSREAIAQTPAMDGPLDSPPSPEAERARSLEVALVDSRSPARFLGEEEPIDPVAGHIPGAVNYFWQEVTNDQGEARSWPEQRDRWGDLAQAQEIWVYCGSGVTACVNLLSLELAGIDQGRLYMGSWSDWCAAGGTAISGSE